MNKPERLSGGHRLCAGCGAGIAARGVLRALKPEDKAVICSATGCLEVSTCLYPYTAWNDSFIHSAFENAGATISGAEAAYRSLKKQGKVKKDCKFIAFGGDGGTYDIGFQSLSGAMERGHDITYICYDNGAYMNTGIQRSSGTPMYANTTTSAVGENSPGKAQIGKNLTEIIAAHNVAYVGQTTFMGNFKDMHEKTDKAVYTHGASFLNIMAPCPRGWRYDAENIMEICKMAVETCFWPLYEIQDGKWTLNYMPKNKRPVEDFLKLQGRFRHLFNESNEYLINDIQAAVDTKWQALLKKCG